MAPDAAYRLIADELSLDGKPKLNLASFVTTWMDDSANELMAIARDRNLADKTEYPQTTDIAARCTNMVANLWNAPEDGAPVATYAIGSSEAGMLAGVAMLRTWEHAHPNWDPRKPRTSVPQPNIVMGTDVQVCWDKFANYFGIEARLIPMREGQYTITPEDVVARVDENTIGVIAILGTTFTGEYEDVQGINDALLDLKKTKGLDIPIHVDGASGGFVAPFDRPELKWDFRLEQVRSINASGHKFGLVYPGIGWVAWRDRKYLPQDLRYTLDYLGGNVSTFNLNFSRPSAQVIAQYYQFLRLGRGGYADLVRAMRTAATRLQQGLLDTGWFTALSAVATDLPVVVVRLRTDPDPGFNVFHLSAKLREKGWIVPAYTMPPDLDGKQGHPSVDVLRMVVREGFSVDLVDTLLADYRDALRDLADGKLPTSVEHRPTPADAGTHKFGVC
jgi:glutamate decarboxylase